MIEDQQLTEPDTSGAQTLTVDDASIIAEELAGYIERRLQQEIAPALDALVKAVTNSPMDRVVPALDALLQAIRMPKALVFDEQGRPTGVKIAE